MCLLLIWLIFHLPSFSQFVQPQLGQVEAMTQGLKLSFLSGWQAPDSWSHPHASHVCFSRKLGAGAELGLEPWHSNRGCRSPRRSLSLLLSTFYISNLLSKKDHGLRVRKTVLAWISPVLGPHQQFPLTSGYGSGSNPNSRNRNARCVYNVIMPSGELAANACLVYFTNVIIPWKM